VDHRKLWELWAGTPRGHLLLPTSFLQNSLHIAIEVRGRAIDVFYISGGRCLEYQQHPQGARHRRLLHLRWWLLPDYRQHPQRAAIDIFFIFSGGCCRSTDSTPRGLAIDVWLKLVPVASIFLATPTRGQLR
jgi:hypothetical protein